MESSDDLYNFWFPTNKSLMEKLGLWFSKGGAADVDKKIKEEFGELVRKARNGELQEWEEVGECLKPNVAFIVLIDQFSRNIYRGTPNMFSHDAKSLAVTLKLLNADRFKELSTEEKLFTVLPLMHQEDMKSQEQCVELIETLNTDVKGTEYEQMGKTMLQFAKDHLEAIEKFGRFPGRNSILERQNTAEEEESLKAGKYKF